MTRDEAKALLPIIQAYTEGKTIQTKIKTDSQGLAEEWIDVINPDLDGNPGCYRIKPKPTYRPFKDAKECWQEMQKHQPFGWAKEISNEKYINLGWVPTEDNEDAFHNITFADGTPFGIEEEEQ